VLVLDDKTNNKCPHSSHSFFDVCVPRQDSYLSKSPFAIIKLPSHKQRGMGTIKMIGGLFQLREKKFTPQSRSTSERGWGWPGGSAWEGVCGSCLMLVRQKAERDCVRTNPEVVRMLTEILTHLSIVCPCCSFPRSSYNFTPVLDLFSGHMWWVTSVFPTWIYLDLLHEHSWGETFML